MVKKKQKKPQKIAEIKVDIFEDSLVTAKFSIVHKYPEHGTHKECMPKKEFIETMSLIVPQVTVPMILRDVSENSVLAMTQY
jgi:hypothetical protein